MKNTNIGAEFQPLKHALPRVSTFLSGNRETQPCQREEITACTLKSVNAFAGAKHQYWCRISALKAGCTLTSTFLLGNRETQAWQRRKITACSLKFAKDFGG